MLKVTHKGDSPDSDPVFTIGQSLPGGTVTVEEAIPGLRKKLARAPTDKILILRTLADQEAARRIERYLGDPDQLRNEVSEWSDLGVEAMRESAAVVTADSWRPQTDVLMEIERILAAEMLTRDVEVLDERES